MARLGPLGRTLLVAAALAAAVAGCGGKDAGKAAREPVVTPPPGPQPPARVAPAEGRLRLIAPPGMVMPAWTKDFERRTGCTVSLRTSDDPVELRRLVGSGRYDAVSATGDAGLQLIADGSVAPINLGLVDGHADLFGGMQGHRIRGRVYTVAQGRAATLLLWRKDKIPGSLKSLDAIYDPAQLQPVKGHLVVHDTPMTIAQAALWLKRVRTDLGITDPYELDARQFDAALAALGVQRDAVDEYWSDPADARAAFSTGEAVVGDGTRALYDQLTRPDGTGVARPPMGSVLPREGTTGWSDAWMVATKARHPGCAYRWLSHVLEPRTNARIAESLGIAPSVRKACQFTRDKDYCDHQHAGDEGYWGQVAFWTTPVADCGDERGSACEDYASWRSAWRQLRDGSS